MQRSRKLSGTAFSLVYALSFSLFLSACASLPTSGEPQGLSVEAPKMEQIEQAGVAPQKDSAPQQLITDFLRACAAGDLDDYATAKQYLLPATAESWQPREVVMIYSSGDEPSVEVISEDAVDSSVSVSVGLDGTVDQVGILASAEDIDTRFDFELRRDSDGQWRISTLEDGVILSQSSFTASFQLTQIYFLSADQQSLVPDPRWFPRKRQASYVVQALLAGPNEQLSPAVSSALSNSLSLLTQGVEIQGQTAHVELVGEGYAGQSTKEFLSWQITASLTQVSNVQDVEISINNVDLDPVSPPFGTKLSLDSAVGLSGGSIVVSEGENWNELISPAEVGDAPSFPSKGPNEENPRVAWLNSDNQLALRDNEGQVSRYSMKEPTEPSVDMWGWVWTTVTGSSGEVVTVDDSGTKKTIQLPDGVKSHVRKVMVSPDGTRVALLLDGSSQTSLWTAVIVRSADGTPVEMAQIRAVTDINNSSSASIVDAAWSNSTNLVAIHSEADGSQEMTIFPLGGFPQSSTLSIEGTVERITAGSQTSKIYLQNSDQELFLRVGTLWRQMGSNTADVSFPG